MSALFQSFHPTDTYTYCDQRTIVIVDARLVAMTNLNHFISLFISLRTNQRPTCPRVRRVGLSIHGGQISSFCLAHICRDDIIALNKLGHQGHTEVSRRSPVVPA